MTKSDKNYKAGKVNRPYKKSNNSDAKQGQSGKRKASGLKIFFGTLFLMIFAGVLCLFGLSTLKNRGSLPQFSLEHVLESKENKEKKGSSLWENLKGERIPEEELLIAGDQSSADSRDGLDADGFDETGCKRNEKGRILEKRITAGSNDGSVSLLFAGDVSFDDSYTNMNMMRQRAGGIMDCFSSETLTVMEEADIFMLNNEFPYTNRGTPTEGKMYTFRSKTDNVNLLGEIGADIVSIANNHVYDYGEISLLDTLDTLRSADVPYVGAGENLTDASETVYFNTGDMRIAFISATQIERHDRPDTKGATEYDAGTFRCWTETLILDQIREAKENSDFVVAYVHWGTESTDEIDWAQRDLAPKMVEAGADLIMGDHPHVLQPIAKVNGVPVVYSLSNYWFNSRACDTCLMRAVINKEGLLSLQFLPAIQSNCFTQLVDGAEKERILSYMRSISGTVSIDGDGYIQ